MERLAGEKHGGMFREAAAFNQDISGWDVSQVTEMHNMFLTATSFDQNLGNWYVVPEDTALRYLGRHPQRHHDIGAEFPSSTATPPITA